MTPDGYRALLRAFSRALHQPLQLQHAPRGAAFAASVASTAPVVAHVVDDGPGAVARLALYQEQFWMRLFATAHEIFPRATVALTPFRMNELVLAFRAGAPSLIPDLADVFDGFCDFALAAPLVTALPHQALVRDALVVDEAERRALRAPAPPLWRDPPDHAVLAVCPGAFVVRVAHDVSARSPVPGPAGARAGHVLVCRAREAVVVVDVDAVFARVFALVAQAPAGAAIAAVRAHVAARLPAEAQAAWPALCAQLIGRGGALGAFRAAPDAPVDGVSAS